MDLSQSVFGSFLLSEGLGIVKNSKQTLYNHSFSNLKQLSEETWPFLFLTSYHNGYLVNRNERASRKLEDRGAR